MRNNFTIEEVNGLKSLVKKGNVMIKVPKKQFQLAQALVPDGNGSWETLMVLSKELTQKIQNLLGENIPEPFHMISLKWFIENYCWF